jgi:hypothetical protein
MSHCVTPTMWEAYWDVAGAQNNNVLTREQLKELVKRFRIKDGRRIAKLMNVRAADKREGYMKSKRTLRAELSRCSATGRFAARAVVPMQVSDVCSLADQATLCAFMIANSKSASHPLCVYDCKLQARTQQRRNCFILWRS